jgi:hypothetical protein
MEPACLPETFLLTGLHLCLVPSGTQMACWIEPVLHVAQLPTLPTHALGLGTWVSV